MEEYNHKTTICKARPRSERLKTGSRAAKPMPGLSMEKERLAEVINIISRPEGLIERIGNSETAIAANGAAIGLIQEDNKATDKKLNSLKDAVSLRPLKTEVPMLNAAGNDFADPALKELLRGPQGERGLQGIQGLQGAKGADGKTWKPTVASDGSLSWAISTSTTAPAAVNIRGQQGLQGVAGKDGKTPVVTLNSSGKLVIDGVTQATSLIGPRGATGATGATGAAGKDGTNGRSSMTGISVGAGFQNAEVGSDFYAGFFDYNLGFRNDVPIPINGTHVAISYKGNSNPSTGANGGSNVSITGYDGALKKIVTLTGNTQVWHYLSQTVTLPSSVKYLGFTIATRNWTAVNTPELLKNFIENLKLVMTLDDGTVIDSDFWKFMNENVYDKRAVQIAGTGMGYVITDKEAKEAFTNPYVSVKQLIQKYGTKLILDSLTYTFELDLYDFSGEVELYAKRNANLYRAGGRLSSKTLSAGYKAVCSITATTNTTTCQLIYGYELSRSKCSE